MSAEMICTPFSRLSCYISSFVQALHAVALGLSQTIAWVALATAAGDVEEPVGVRG